MHHLASSKGGKCLSTDWSNTHAKYLFQCANGHDPWPATADSIFQGSWCPYCDFKRGEEITRCFFENVFGKPFPTVWPPWLRNSRNNVMQLDGYNEELQIAFEHQGSQHFKIGGLYCRNNQDLLQRQEDDNQKLKLCHNRNIKLFIIPEIPGRLKIEKFRDHVAKQAAEMNLSLPEDFLTREIDYSSISPPNVIQLMQKHAEQKGGRLLVSTYLTSTTPVEWCCSKGHKFRLSWHLANTRNYWCSHKDCAGNVKLSLEEIKQRLQEILPEIECLSTTYSNAHTKLDLKCRKCSYWWQATWNKLSQAKIGCHKCAENRQYTLEDIVAIAKVMGFEVVSEKIERDRTVRIRCTNGHLRKARISRIVSGEQGCGACSGRDRGSLDDVRKILEGTDLELQSSVYSNARSPLLIRCRSRGHDFERTRDSLTKNKTCPVCNREKKASKVSRETLNSRQLIG